MEQERIKGFEHKLRNLGRVRMFEMNENEAIVRGKNSVISGRECPINFVAFALMRIFSDLDKWTWRKIELILDAGNQLYIDSMVAYRPVNPVLTVVNTLRRFAINNFEFKLKVMEPLFFKNFSEEYVELVLETVFVETNFCLFGHGDFVVTLHFKAGHYYLFDPFPRDIYGLRTGKNGSAMLMRFKQMGPLVHKLVYNLRDPRVQEQDVENTVFSVLFLELQSVTKVP